VNSPTSGGWADLLILFEVRGSNRHICEVQIGFKSMISARKEGEGHAAYMRARDAIEVIEATGGVFEFQCAAPKTSGDGSGEMAAGQDEPAESAPRDDALLENERLLKQVRVLQWTHWMGIHLTANRVWSHSHQAGFTLSHRRVPTRSHRGVHFRL
jgi:hypothetical protein